MTGLGDCPSGCGQSVSLGKLMCGPCWAEVPRRLQREVLSTWAAHRKLMRGDRTLEQVRASRALYESAKDAAIASIA